MAVIRRFTAIVSFAAINLVAGFGLVVPAHAGPISIGTIPFVLEDNRVYVELLFSIPDGSPRKAWTFVDIGTPNPLVSPALYKDLQLDKEKQLTFQIGDLSVGVPSEKVVKSDWFYGFRKNTEFVLPGSIMEHYQIAIDYSARTLTFAKGSIRHLTNMIIRANLPTMKMRGTTEPKFVPQMTLADFEQMFPDEESCWTYLLARRWPNGPECPRCGNDHVYESKARPWHWQCMKCGPKPRSPYRFSLKTKTIFEETKMPLRTWFKVLHLMLTSKKGISALQIHRLLGTGKYQTAWYICMRLRAGMKDPEFRQLMGIVEIDETFIGGKRGKMHKSKRDPHGWGQRGKIPVIGAIARKGN